MDKIRKIVWFRAEVFVCGKGFPAWFPLSDPDYLQHSPSRIVKYSSGYQIEDYAYSAADECEIWVTAMRGCVYRTLGEAKEAFLSLWKEYI